MVAPDVPSTGKLTRVPWMVALLPLLNVTVPLVSTGRLGAMVPEESKTSRAALTRLGKLRVLPETVRLQLAVRLAKSPRLIVPPSVALIPIMLCADCGVTLVRAGRSRREPVPVAWKVVPEAP